MQLNSLQATIVHDLIESGVKSFKLCFDKIIVNSYFSAKIEVIGTGFDEYYDTKEDFTKAYNLS